MRNLPSEEQKADLDKIKASLDQLGEHFDTVQIFATKHDGGDDGATHSFHKGIGNWWARFGQVVEWVTKSKEDARVEARKDADE